MQVSEAEGLLRLGLTRELGDGHEFQVVSPSQYFGWPGCNTAPHLPMGIGGAYCTHCQVVSIDPDVIYTEMVTPQLIDEWAKTIALKNKQVSKRPDISD